jgi:hypothetical protein
MKNQMQQRERESGRMCKSFVTVYTNAGYTSNNENVAAKSNLTLIPA